MNKPSDKITELIVNIAEFVQEEDWDLVEKMILEIASHSYVDGGFSALNLISPRESELDKKTHE